MMSFETEPEVSRLSAEEIKQRLDRGEPLFFCDVRRHPDDFQIKGAVYFDPEAVLTAEQVEIPGLKDKGQLIITY